MIKLQLESTLDILNLNEVQEKGTGFQALTGMTGAGLPPVSVQWLEGAGDGSVYRGRRVLSRDIDLPLDIVGRDRAHLADLLSRLARVLAEPCTLALVNEDGSRWTTEVVRTGGGDVTYGQSTTGERDLQTVLTLRADPYFTSSEASFQVIGGDTKTASLLSNLASLPVAASQAIGSITLENAGDSVAYPVWEIHGPGYGFQAVSPDKETLAWGGTIAAGEVLTVDARTGSVVDQAGTNRYADLAPAPRFWSIKPGLSTATAQLLGVTADSKIICSWRPRKWMVI
ncbi:phage tail family protein [Kitasatospora sp. NBC_01302]|uniref:phage tail family protein n=1 Tax=Kitasatospora sp. NBC_01302 TaxID=2903575 RepID=UPI002E1501CF|nr:phage tail family protein [Kitasatospora sp. NBC_01302]